MAATTREAIRELLQQTISTIGTLLEASDEELTMPSSHGCAQGKDLWTLLTNDIDHEKIHTGRVLECRCESKMTSSPMERLVAEWLAERARFVGSLVRRAPRLSSNQEVRIGLGARSRVRCSNSVGDTLPRELWGRTAL